MGTIKTQEQGYGKTLALRRVRPRVFFLLALAPVLVGQAQRIGGPAFEVVSIKYSGSIQDHIVRTSGDMLVNVRPVQFIGNRLTADDHLEAIAYFAFSGVVSPDRSGMPMWARQKYYRIEAIAPPGTTIDGARAMLVKVLTERLALRYRIVDKEMSLFNLQLGSGPLKLVPSTESDPPGPRRHEQWRLKSKGATVAQLARFLSGGMQKEVVDRTGLQGKYQFNLDWSEGIKDERIDEAGPRLALEEAKRLGLKIVSAKETRKLLVVDSANEKPTPN